MFIWLAVDGAGESLDVLVQNRLVTDGLAAHRSRQLT